VARAFGSIPKDCVASMSSWHDFHFLSLQNKPGLRRLNKTVKGLPVETINDSYKPVACSHCIYIQVPTRITPSHFELFHLIIIVYLCLARRIALMSPCSPFVHSFRLPRMQVIIAIPLLNTFFYYGGSVG